MKTKSINLSLGAVVLLMAFSVSAQNLFVATYSTGYIYQITPGGASSVFATR
jgi:hypothetical protein